jgi:uncharacterized membrane protein YfcA
MDNEYIFQLILIAAINFAAAFLQAASGFGYAMLAMTLMPLVLPMKYCSAISAGTVVSIAIQMVIMLRKNLNIRIVAVPVFFCILTINLGIYMLMTFKEFTLRLILAVFIFFLAGFHFYCQKKNIKIKKSLINSAISGSLTGISTGMFNIVGPFFLVYYMNIFDNTLAFKASMEFSFLIAGLYSTAMHIIYGNISATTLPFVLVSVASSVIAGFFGIKLFKKIDRKKISLIIYVVLPIMALMLLLKG